MGEKSLKDFRSDFSNVEKNLYKVWDILEGIPISSLKTKKDKELVKSFRNTAKKFYTRIQKNIWLNK